MSSTDTSISDSITTPIVSESEFIKDNACSICTEVIGEPREDGTVEEATATKCGHRFGADCLEHWLQEHTTCPMCRTTLKDAAPVAARPPRTPLATVNATWSMRYTGLVHATNPPVLLDRAERDRLLSALRIARIEEQLRRYDMAAQVRAAAPHNSRAEDMWELMGEWANFMQAHRTRRLARSDQLESPEEVNYEGFDVLFGDTASEHNGNGQD